jgi:hypothetical protein
MKYRFEWNGNPDYVTLHITERLADGYVSATIVGASDKDKYTLGLLNGALGAEEVSLRDYSVSIKRGAAFDRDDVLKSALEILLMHLRMSGIVNDDDTVEQLPTLRSDILQIKCSDCVREERREMELSMRTWDTLEY